MFCFILMIIFILIYLVLQKDNRTSSKYLAATLIAYIVTVFAMILYLSKDTYYYNIVNTYFALPKSVWKYLMFINLPKNMIIRMLTISSLAVVFLGYCFSTSYQIGASRVVAKKIKGIILGILLVQILIYDPYIQYIVYNICYPKLMTLEQIGSFNQILHICTVIINNGIIIYSIVRLFYTYKKVHFLHFLRSYFIVEVVCYTLVMIAYIIIFWFSPMFLIKISKIADYVSYLSVPLSSNQLIYSAFSYFLLVTTLLCAFSIYRLMLIKRKMNNKEFSIKKQIDAADTTSKIFCHYMKNELLAIESEVELFHVTSDNEKEIQAVLNRCNNLYQRLDEIHKSTQNSKLNLVETDLTVLVQTIIKKIKKDTSDIQFGLQIGNNIPVVMTDQYYFEQAILNIIDNAIDSMEGMPEESKKMTLNLQYIGSWVVLTIQDTGIGISESNLKNIFTPLYSSKPITKHWGIGLALTHRIITAHEGKIEVESHENAGTIFKIFIPDLQKYMD